MNPEITAAIELLKAKVNLMAQHCGDPRLAVTIPARIAHLWPSFEKKPPTLRQLEQVEEPIELELRHGFSAEAREQVRRKLIEQFGRATVGETWETTARKILARGHVKEREVEAMRTFVDANIAYAQEVLGEADANRLLQLLTDHLVGKR